MSAYENPKYHWQIIKTATFQSTLSKVGVSDFTFFVQAPNVQSDMEYETYETDNDYDDMYAAEGTKTKVWMQTKQTIFQWIWGKHS